ncbi:bifunctional phosphoribosylaminoimidazolecarboxamide formyltransferase/IMP cyclohydrolase [Candidatus Erwinia haradaeae]|uniref:Bifunctional purine biosynthesis protein PurH n=1 Tax=Candidatus Erwinia haradaeae TaxID=1922217 RepID=A0A451DI96_9GAMM|nr:bifunctional phosphoribosylaminoimidazolecarboxamide formyltransferase/IMP cyclohydrolase [Candidatus Erwinia haradaeae]VFP86387.1 Bifunctional purine biosynthesis protein PurH [Candidatus Erwinia haradaeae]
MIEYRPIRRALISVFDKVGILEFAQALCQREIEIFSTGGTARFLSNAGLSVTEVSDYTGVPEMMGGRLKTLHPKVHGGILGRRDQDNDFMTSCGIVPIDMVVVNLYPFQEVISHGGALDSAIENIDIGGVAMVRSAAKNYKDVAIVIESSEYRNILRELDINNNALTKDTRFHLAIKAFEYTAEYDSKISNYFKNLTLECHSNTSHLPDSFPNILHLNFIKKQDIRYGENRHQLAAFYINNTSIVPSVSTAQQVQGKILSYNNISDANAALECVKGFKEPACVIIKHANPCGAALSDNIFDAYIRAYQTDPDSAFGGVIAFNRALDAITAQEIINRQFVEVIIVPFASDDALRITATKKNLRVLICGQQHTQQTSLDLKSVRGGLLVQDHDIALINKHQLRIVSQRAASQKELSDALFCWKVVKFVKSNAIVYACNHRTIGIGSGQTSRVYSVKIAAMKAAEVGLSIKGSVMASDGFFPFRDSIDIASDQGVTCIIQPGGSIHDDKIIAAADEHEMVMIFTDMRHFCH